MEVFKVKMPLWGEETEKALKIVGRGQTPPPLIKAYGQVKLATLMAQQESSSLYPPRVYNKLVELANAIIRGELKEHFPLPLEQGGAGTSLHMNICEVLANGAKEEAEAEDFPLNPLEHLALYQSTNDTFSTAVILMAYGFLEEIEQEVIRLQEELVYRESLYESWLMCGRTELQEALPITLGQVFGAWAGPIERDRWRLSKLKERLRTIPLGGTAIGTSFSAPRNYIFKAEKALRKVTGLPLSRSQNLCDQVAHLDSLAEMARGVALCADNLFKISGDLLLYSASFLREIPLKEEQFGSTIMPNKTNPVLLELIRGLCLSASSKGELIASYAKQGQMQLNAYLPFMAQEIIIQFQQVKKALYMAHTPLMKGLQPHKETLEKNLIQSKALLNTLRPFLGYQGVKDLIPLLREKELSTLDDFIHYLIKTGVLSQEEALKWGNHMNLTAGAKL